MDTTIAKWGALAAGLAVVVALCWWCYQMGRDDKMDTIGHLQTVNGNLDSYLKACEETVDRLAPAASIKPATGRVEQDEVPGGEPAAVEDWSSAYNIQATVTQVLELAPDTSIAIRRIYREGEKQLADLEVRTPSGVESGTLALGETGTIGDLRLRVVDLTPTQASLFVDLGSS